jgi:hypothetical protein
LRIYSRRQLGELDAITERLKARYYATSDGTSTPHSNMTSDRCNSVPPPASNLHTTLQVPTNLESHRSDVDTARSTSTTIKTNFLEQFPESLSGRPLMSNGLNVTDVLSLHNDQVRLAQELMSRANHLLETSKDFFIKAPTPPPSTLPTALPVIEQTRSSPLPPALPQFEVSREFRSPATAEQHIEHIR